jgi:large subunit ribosomal protein L24
MTKIRKNDTVRVIQGKDKGKTGKVLHVYPKIGRALVEGVNFVKKHTRRTQKDQQGGIVTKESPIAIGKLMFLCKACGKPARIAYTKLSDGTKARACKKCSEIIS